MNHPPIFDSDAYGVDTDNPVSAYEIIENSLTLKEERKIASAIEDFIIEQAHEVFNTSTWDCEMWEAWRRKISKLF